MALGQEQATSHEKTEYDINDPRDKKIVKEFEAEIARYLNECEELFGRIVGGFDLYLHKKGLFRYTEKYPSGAVNWGALYEYRHAQMKWRALQELWFREKKANMHRQESFEALANQAA